MIRDISVAVILYFVFTLGKDYSDWNFFWIIVITFLVMTVITIAFQSWDRFNPYEFGDL